MTEPDLAIPDWRGQLFFSYSMYSDQDPSSAEVLATTRTGSLVLFPHPATDIPLQPVWDEDPLADHNWRFQYHSLFWLDRIRAAAIELNSEAALQWYETTLQSWVEANPRTAPMSDYSWFDMGVGIRVIVLAFGLAHLGERDWLIEVIREHGAFLADPANYDAAGNHGLHQDMGLLVAGQILHETDWLNLAATRIEAMIRNSVDSEGTCREGSVDYQYRNYRWFHEALIRIELAGLKIDDEALGSVDRMPEFLAHATAPDGGYVMVGDTVAGRAPSIEGTAANWTVDRKCAPAETARVFTGGYIFARRSWDLFSEQIDNAHLVQRFGPGRSSAVHGHDDAASIILTAFDETLLRDSGLYAYEAGADREYFRGRYSHNVVDVPDVVYYPSARSDLIAHHNAFGVIHSSISVRGLETVKWVRTMLWAPEEALLVVDDRVNSSVAHPEVFQRWQLPPGALIDTNASDGQATIKTSSGVLLKLHQISDVWPIVVETGQADPPAGWLSNAYRSRIEAPRLSLKGGGQSLRFTTAFTYGLASQPVPEIVFTSRTSSRAAVVVSRPDKTRLRFDITTRGYTVQSEE